MITQMVERQQEIANGLNSIEHLLAEHVRAQNAAIEWKESESSPHLTTLPHSFQLLMTCLQEN
jgi:hypothetical protein